MIALKDGSIDVYAWAQRPYQKFMVYKSFPQLQHKPQLVDLMINDSEGKRQTLVGIKYFFCFITCNMHSALFIKKKLPDFLNCKAHAYLRHFSAGVR